MGRIIKKADERQAEILETARGLFLSRGYDATTVNDLIQAIGISKGAFYHHFASKEDVLSALVWSMAEQGLALQEPLFARDDLSPFQKIQAFFVNGQQFKKEQAPGLRAFIEILYRAENLKLRLRAAEQMTELLVPPLGKVLTEGAAQGEFDIEDPEETARLILNLGGLVHEAFAVALRLSQSDYRAARMLLQKRADSYERAIERLLGVPKHSLSIIDAELIALFLAPATQER